MSREPGLRIAIDDEKEVFAPGATLAGSVQLDACEGREVEAIELSMEWWTEGKGDEDRKVLHNQRLSVSGNSARFAVPLPRSPLSYDGLIVKIYWQLTVRLVVAGWRDRVETVPFRLGDLASVREAVT